MCIDRTGEESEQMPGGRHILENVTNRKTSPDTDINIFSRFGTLKEPPNQCMKYGKIPRHVEMG